VPLRIIPVDVYGEAETTSAFDVAHGLTEALNRGVNVVNLSLGGENESPLLRSLIAEASRRGVVFVGAAGNEPVTTPVYPAAIPSVISVTAADAPGTIAPWANHGRWIDAMAPATNVVTHQGMSWLGSGTSFSTSWVSGWVAGSMSAGVRSASSVQSQAVRRFPYPR
jgi:hypothetical protein